MINERTLFQESFRNCKSHSSYENIFNIPNKFKNIEIDAIYFQESNVKHDECTFNFHLYLAKYLQVPNKTQEIDVYESHIESHSLLKRFSFVHVQFVSCLPVRMVFFFLLFCECSIKTTTKLWLNRTCGIRSFAFSKNNKQQKY